MAGQKVLGLANGDIGIVAHLRTKPQAYAKCKGYHKEKRPMMPDPNPRDESGSIHFGFLANSVAFAVRSISPTCTEEKYRL